MMHQFGVITSAVVLAATLLCADDKAITIGFFADAQGSDKDTVSTRHYRDSIAKVKDFVAVMNEWKPDIVVHLGDLIDTWSPVYTREISTEVARLTMPCHFVLGNHDVPRREFTNMLSRQLNSYYSFIVKGLTFIILDGNWNADGSKLEMGSHWNKVYLVRPQLEWLTLELTRAAGKAIVLIHQRIDEENAMNPHALMNAAEVRRTLENSGKVLAVFQGHDHRTGTRTVINDIPYFTIFGMVEEAYPAVSYAKVVLSITNGSISLSGAGKQPSYEATISPAAVPVMTGPSTPMNTFMLTFDSEEGFVSAKGESIVTMNAYKGGCLELAGDGSYTYKSIPISLAPRTKYRISAAVKKGFGSTNRHPSVIVYSRSQKQAIGTWAGGVANNEWSVINSTFETGDENSVTDVRLNLYNVGSTDRVWFDEIFISRSE